VSSTGRRAPNANLGWYPFNRGQLARRRPPAAAAEALDLGPALSGRDWRRTVGATAAIQFLPRALSVTSSGPGEQALDASQAEDAQQPPPSPDAVPAPRRDDWTRGARAPRVVIVDPVVPRSNEEHVAVGMGKNGAIVEGYREQAKALIARQQGLRPNAGRDRPPCAPRRR
jgi:hypothetical protein